MSRVFIWKEGVNEISFFGSIRLPQGDLHEVNFRLVPGMNGLMLYTLLDTGYPNCSRAYSAVLDAEVVIMSAFLTRIG